MKPETPIRRIQFNDDIEIEVYVNGIATVCVDFGDYVSWRKFMCWENEDELLEMVADYIERVNDNG
jgi:hypothetical protein